MNVTSSSEIYPEHHFRRQPIPNLHALLIGIDTYAKVINLSGAARDADSIENFLRSDLSVPPSQITNLRNEQATRSGILFAFDELRRNPNIFPFDPIVIYYAGHGCEVDTPSTGLDSDDQKTQCLVPWDAGTQDAGGNPIPPIPDYTIGALLYALAAEKGNNITVIFDCCHSASSTRGVTHPGLNEKLSKWKIGFHSIPKNKLGNYRARRLDPKDLPRLAGETDMGILQTHARIYTNLAASQTGYQQTLPDPPLSGFRRFGRSHVLLAACAHAEIAYECTTSDGGYFTTSLLQRLRSSRIDKLTYKVCFQDFPRLLTPSLQSPVCEGDDTGRLFFSTQAPEGYRNFIPIQQLVDGCSIKAGMAQGVIPGSVYGVYEDDIFDKDTQSGDKHRADQNLPIYETFTANPCPATEQSLYPCHSRCNLPADALIPSHPLAKLLSRGTSHRFEVFLTDVLEREVSGGALLQADQGIIQVNSPNQSKVILDLDEKDGQMTIALTCFADTLLHKCKLDWAKVQSILFSMAQWNWHLFREPPAGAKSKKERVQLHIYRLDKEGPTLIPSENGVATLTVSPRDVYGFKLKSLFNRRLYAYLFYFSTMSQSIKPLFLSVYGSGYVDAPLEPNGELTIGYGNDDMISGPLSFRPAPDVGHFRLFLTTLPGDFDSMAQSSPFVEPEKLKTMSWGSGDEYSDGIEIRKPESADCGQVANPILSANLAGRSNGTVRQEAEMTGPKGVNDVAPTSDATALHRRAFKEILFAGRSRIGLPPRVLTDSETSEKVAKRDIWDVVTLKVVLKSGNC
ncbi:caspase domain-containing protein [Rhizoctonia solani]|nr:caspase domain-containing protein [Rhizoctonia solani]